jgi:SAM-dependent methyltransferase
VGLQPSLSISFPVFPDPVRIKSCKSTVIDNTSEFQRMLDEERMKPSPLNEVRDIYEATADSYARMMDAEIQLPIYPEVLGRLHCAIDGLPGAVIDAACGSGHMLAMYRDLYKPQRRLVGMDLSPRMVSIARERLGSDADLFVGDMRELRQLESDSAAALLNWYAVHHLSAAGLREAMKEWFRVLGPGGQLWVAAWEGAGLIDYGNEADIVAVRYSQDELTALAREAGFEITSCVVVPVEDFPMDAVHLECIKQR